jgi:xanthine dehydrogenase accessory factor
VGTVGGGAIEYAIVEALRAAQRSGQSQLVVYNLGYDLGMCCGGRMEVFVEPIEAVQRLFLFGAGHVAQATAPLARSVGFAVVVVDDREELNSDARFPGCQRELLDATELLRRQTLAEQDWVLIATHDHHLDEQTLELCVRQRARYIGLVGSRRKVFRLVTRIAARHPALAFDRVYAPVGLDVGAVGPEEIAVSIIAELVALKHGKAVPHLRAVDDVRLQKQLDDAAPADEAGDVQVGS